MTVRPLLAPTPRQTARERRAEIRARVLSPAEPRRKPRPWIVERLERQVRSVHRGVRTTTRRTLYVIDAEAWLERPRPHPATLAGIPVAGLLATARDAARDQAVLDARRGRARTRRPR